MVRKKGEQSILQEPVIYRISFLKLTIQIKAEITATIWYIRPVKIYLRNSPGIHSEKRFKMAFIVNAINHNYALLIIDKEMRANFVCHPIRLKGCPHFIRHCILWAAT